MYRTKEISYRENEAGRVILPREEKEKLFSLDTLLNLSETIATMAIGAGFLLLVAACLSAL